MDGRPPPTRTELEGAFRQLYRLHAETRWGEAETAATVQALVETLASAGVLPLSEFELRRGRLIQRAKDELAARHNIQLASYPDKYQVASPDVDCAALIPICKARCCKLKVCLSQQDVDEGILSWDYEKPYQIRRRDGDGYCVYSEGATGRCMVYAHRPAICRGYDCRDDPRIWKDFANRVLAD